MYRGSHPASGVDHQPSSPAAMLAINMNRLPSIPSRPAPLHPPTTYSSHAGYATTPSQPEMFPPSQHHRPRDHDGGQSNAQQLPSLHTLLEPELLGNKLPDPPTRSGGAHFAHGRLGSSSPTLKRRHDFDRYSHEHLESNAIPSRTTLAHHHAHNFAPTEAQLPAYPTPGVAPGPRQMESSHHGGLGPPIHDAAISNMYRQPSMVSAMSAPSDLTGSFAGNPPLGDPMDPTKPIRRRTEGSSRAPARASRYVDTRVIPGEGLCYVYEDGTYCRAVIDGEPVNPSWGITKAGKPRKRLAQACLTCREKKIKCEPGWPKCHQCAKSQRACRNGLGMSNASADTSPSSSSALFKSQSMELVSPVAGPDKSRALEEQRDPSRTAEAWNAIPGSSSRLRNFRPTSVATSRDMSVHSADSDWSGSLNQADPDDPRRGARQDQLAVHWEQDPYEMDAEITMQLLDLYFFHAGRATYGMFPRQPFRTWVETHREKSPDQLMLLYSLLAVGSIYSTDDHERTLGRRFADVAAYATEKRFGKFTLQLCQSRLMLALYNFARGRAQEAWDFCGAALRAMGALRLNTEEGIQGLLDSSTDLDYGLDRRTLEECCRRTLWSGFLMDRYNGFCGGTVCVLNIEDTFVRLPCPENLLEACTPGENPFFDFDLLSSQALSGLQLGHMAYLILISAIWGEVLTFTSRAVHRPDTGYERVYETFYAKACERLDVWRNTLPHNLRYTPDNLDASVKEGYAGSFISLHALYHATVIRLNRHMRVRTLPLEQVARNIEQCFRNASSFLSMIHALTTVTPQGRLPFLSSPFPGYALMLSVDVLSSAGTVPMLHGLVESIGHTVTYMEELGTFWSSARTQANAISERLRRLTEIARMDERGVRNGDYGPFWRLPDSLESSFGGEDAVYKADNHVLFDVVGKLTGH